MIHGVALAASRRRRLPTFDLATAYLPRNRSFGRLLGEKLSGELSKTQYKKYCTNFLQGTHHEGTPPIGGRRASKLLPFQFDTIEPLRALRVLKSPEAF